jgi:hypothetical protein
MKIGDVSRRRRLSDPVRMRWYAHHRSIRFARRMMQAQVMVVLSRSSGASGGCMTQ